MQLIAASFWPIVVLVAVFAFRGTLANWLKRPPTELEVNAGPVRGRVKWDAVVGEALEQLDESAGSETSSLPPAQAGSGDQPEQPSSPEPLPAALPLRLREAARHAPSGAISEAWMLIEMEVDQLLTSMGAPASTGPLHARRPLRRRLWQEYFDEAIADRGLAEWVPPMLKKLSGLRNMAVHTGPVTSDQAYEFLTLADLVVNELRRASNVE